MKKILVVFTGGTIASGVENGYISPDGKNAYKLLDMYEKENKKRAVEFFAVSPYNILSENLNPGYICRLVLCIKENIKKGGYDGVIVAHGTDTLPYSAAALSYAFGLGSIPIVLVSSNYILEDKRQNGYKNFCAAVAFIEGGYGRGAFVSYQNADKTLYIHRASRILNHVMYTDDVISVKNSYYARLEGDIFIKNENYFETADETAVFDFEKYSAKRSVLMLNIYPGERFNYDLKNVFAVLLCSYHSGTVNTDSGELKAFLSYAKKSGVPVFLLGGGKKVLYASAKDFDKLGLKLIDFAAPPAMYIKLLFGECAGVDIYKLLDKSLGADILKNS